MDTHSLKGKRWQKIFHVNRSQKRTGVAIPASDKIIFQSKTVIGAKKMSLYKGVNSSRNNNKYMYPSSEYLKI